MPGTIPNEARSSRLLSLIATILVVAVLYLGRAVLVPLALAVLLSFLLTPLVIRLQRAGLPRIPGVLVVCLLASGFIAAIGYVVTVETISLAESLPQYRQNILEKVRTISAPGMFSRATESLRQTSEDVIRATTQPEEPTTHPTTNPADPHPLADRASEGRDDEEDEADDNEPMQVEIVEDRPNALESIATTVHPLLGPLGTAGIIIVFVIFMLIQREDLRDRMIALSGTNQINATTEALDDAAKRVSRYLLMQFIVNATYGIAAAIGLLLIGVPNAVLWGVLCVVFRYIPYVGPWIGAALPIMLSLAVFDGWTTPLMVIGLFIVLELISNNAVEPWLYGSGTGVSPMAVLIAAVFWTWLWGVPGLVLSTPLTVCVVVLGKHVPQMKWLAVLLGDEPGLPLPARVYQRLLAADHDELVALAQEYMEDHTLMEWYEAVLMPALCMAETDRHEGTLDDRRQQIVFDEMRELVDELGESAEQKAAATDKADAKAAAKAVAAANATEAAKSNTTPAHVPSDSAAGPTKPDLASRPLILIVAARDDADEIAATMLAQLLALEGLRTQVVPSAGLAGEASDRAAAAKPAIICISAMPPMAVSHARYMCKRLHEKLPETKLIVGVWNATDLDRATQRVRTGAGGGGGETVVNTLAKAIEALRM